MRREDIEKLLGGYATGTLTESERQALYEAALGDQQLFDALMREEALREILADPRSRRGIVEALEQPRGLRTRLFAWLHTPPGWAFAGSAIAVVALTAVLVRVGRHEQPVAEFAMAKKQEAVPAAPAPTSDVRNAPAPAKAQPQQAPRAAAPTRRFAPPQASAALGKEARRADIPAPPELAAAPPQPLEGTPQVVSRLPLPPAPPAQSQALADAVTIAQSGARDLFYGRFVADEADAARRERAEANAEYRAPAREMAKSRVAMGTIGAAGQAQRGLGLRYTLVGRRLTMQANQAGQIYLFGARGLLYTTEVQPGRDYTYDAPAAETALSVVLSRVAEGGQPASLLARTRSQIERVPLQVQTVDNATYIVNPSVAPDAKVFVEVRVR